MLRCVATFTSDRKRDEDHVIALERVCNAGRIINWRVPEAVILLAAAAA